MNPLASVTKPIVIMGGSERLPYEMSQTPDDAVRVSCNWHALTRYRADYMVFMDKIVGKVPMKDIIKRYDVPTISHRDYATHVVRRPMPSPINSGIFATYLATQSNQPVYLAGFDFYRTGYLCGGKAPDKNLSSEYFDRCVEQLRTFNNGNLIVISQKIKGRM